MWSFLSSLGFALEPLRSSVARGFAIVVAGQCCCCGLPSDTPDPLCSCCCATLPRVQNPCIRCGLSCADLSGSATHRAAVPAPRHDDELVPLCSACLLTPPAFDYCCSAFAYRSPIDRLVSGLKFNARGDIGVALSGQLCHRLQSLYSAKSGTHPWPSAVLAIPLHPARLRQRGYNQAFEVSKIVSRRLKICDLGRCRDHERNRGGTRVHPAKPRRAPHRCVVFSAHGVAHKKPSALRRRGSLTA